MVRTITITEDAYESLAKLKRSPQDSFSKVILRLTQGPGDPLEVAGAWEDMTEEEARSLVEASRRDFQSWGGEE